MNVMSEEELLKTQLEELKREHRSLDEEIAEMTAAPGGDALAIRLLKKRKLVLKDRIAWIEDQLYPDIIA
ncbi:MAG: DUF465 domain-containing protein [Pseudomonadota bacterium]